MLLSLEEWRRRILKVLFVDHILTSTTKENIFSNFTGHIDYNTDLAFSSLVKDELLIKMQLKDKIHYCLNIFQKADQIHSEMNGTKSSLIKEIDQPLDKEFDTFDFVFVTEANRAYPNRGKYYHCRKKSDNSYWKTLVKPRGNTTAKRLVLGSLNDPKSRLFRIYKAIKIVAKNSRHGEIIKKHVEDIEPNACGNTRQYSKAAFDILEYLNIIQAVESKGRMIKYQLVKREEGNIQLTIDEIFDELLKMKITR